nr:hypothetical protein [uncultured Lacibacter sp.]
MKFFKGLSNEPFFMLMYGQKNIPAWKGGDMANQLPLTIKPYHHTNRLNIFFMSCMALS